MPPEGTVNNLLLDGRLPRFGMKYDFFHDSIEVARGDCFVGRQVDDISDWRDFEESERGREWHNQRKSLAQAKANDANFPPTSIQLVLSVR